MTEAPAPASRLSRLNPDLLALPILGLPYAWLVARFWFVCDDAFISFRFARNLAEGHGLRYNLGAEVPVEGYSNFLWVLICAAIERLGGLITIWPPIVSIVCGAGLLALVYRSLRRDLALGVLPSILAGLCLATAPGFAAWSTSGLETMPAALLMFAMFRGLVLNRDAKSAWVAAGAGLLLSLIRVEGLYWALVIWSLAMFVRMFGDGKIKPALSCLAAILIGYGIYWAWRYGYYHTFFANTAHAKVGVNRSVLIRGTKYLLVNVISFIPYLLILPGAYRAIWRWRWREGLAISAMAAGPFAFALLMGGDFMALGRLLVPSLPFVALLIGLLLGEIAGLDGRRARGAALVGIVVAAAGAAGAFNFYLVPTSWIHRLHFRYSMTERVTETEMWWRQKHNALHWSLEGMVLADHSRPDDRVLHIAIGAVGYYSRRYIIDQCGLVTRSDPSRMRLMGRASPGHDQCRPLLDCLDDRPEILWSALVTWKHVKAFSEEVKSSKYADRYVLEVPASVPRPGLKQPYYLIVCRRLAPGEDAAAAWADYLRWVDRFGQSQTPPELSTKPAGVTE